jgi:hypothetical protein
MGRAARQLVLPAAAPRAPQLAARFRSGGQHVRVGSALRIYLRAYLAVDHVLDVKVGRNFEHAVEVISNLSAGFRMVYATWVLEGEVNNGGFNPRSPARVLRPESIR